MVHYDNGASSEAVQTHTHNNTNTYTSPEVSEKSHLAQCKSISVARPQKKLFPLHYHLIAGEEGI